MDGRPRPTTDRGRTHEPVPFALVQAAIYTTARLGLAGWVTDDVERVLGRPPRSLAEYVRDYAAEFDWTAPESETRHAE